ncbi:MAG: hypothetical protein CMJ78_02625 [Planctomycetaceae bacterium]|nr:hypothetical protein [Planctomycetaceae bacterium]
MKALSQPSLVMIRGLVFLAALQCLNGASAQQIKVQLEPRSPWTTGKITGSPESPPPYRLERIYPDLTFKQPIAMIAEPKTKQTFLIEREGRILQISKLDPFGIAPIFLDGRAQIDGLTAVYGLAFHPGFEKNRTCFLCYILKQGLENGTRVSRFRVTDGETPRIDADSEEILLSWRSGGHNGGCLMFGPDGYLYISTGDGSPPSPPDVHDSGQDVSDLLGSILRIDVNSKSDGKGYSIPHDNPFKTLKGARGEVWAYGLRNPWRMSFDRKTGELWLGDVGWQLWEMVHLVKRGGNYGWSVMEGPQSVRPEVVRGPTEITPATLALPRAEAASVTGGYVYRGKRLPKLTGSYVYGDYVTGKIWALKYADGKVVSNQELLDSTVAIIAFHEDIDGELSLMDYNGGGVYRLQPNQAGAENRDFPTRLSQTGLFDSVKDESPAPGVLPFAVNVEQWQDGAIAQRWVAVPGDKKIKLTKPEGRVPLDWGEFPDDTVLVKTISLENGNGKLRKVETQILHMRGDKWRGNSGEWFGYSYIWNEEQNDAVLAPKEGILLTIELSDRSAPGGIRHHRWEVSSRTKCYACHNPWAGYRLAFTPEQLNRKTNFQGLLNNQISTLQNFGVLEEGIETKVAYANPFDELKPLAARARSYLHVNCSHCHRFGGGGTATIDLRYEASLADMKLVGQRPTQGHFGIASAKLVAGGDPYRSVLFYRMSKLGPGRMPHIGSQQVDQRATQLIADWIRSMPYDRTRSRIHNRQHIDEATALIALRNSKVATEKPIETLLASTSAALKLLNHIDRQRIHKSNIPMIAELATRHDSVAVRDLFERFLSPDKRAKRLGSVIDSDKILAMSGDVARGNRLIQQTETTKCLACHQINGKGGEVGPDLSATGKQRQPREILESIVEPSKRIDPKFITYLIETSEGKLVTGVLVEKTVEAVTLRTVQNKTVKVPMSRVELFVPQKKSIMPDLLFRDMTPQQLADLMAYLVSLKGTDQ